MRQGRTSLFIGLLFLAACLREPYDCRMGRHVATDADLSLRLVASAATKPDLCQAEPHAGGTRPKRQKLNSLPMFTGFAPTHIAHAPRVKLWLAIAVVTSRFHSSTGPGLKIKRGGEGDAFWV